jgi:hypothetical protein
MSWSRSLASMRRYAEHPDRVVDQIGRLSSDAAEMVQKLGHKIGKEATHLGKEASHLGKEAGHAASAAGSELVHQLTPVAMKVGRSAVRTGLKVRDGALHLRNDPAPAIVALGTLALIAMLLMSRTQVRR